MNDQLLDIALELIAYIETNYSGRKEGDMLNAMHLVKTMTLGDSFKTVFDVVDFYFAD